MKLAAITIIALISFASSDLYAATDNSIASRLSAILSKPENDLDFGRVKAEIDSIVDSSVSVATVLASIDSISVSVLRLAGADTTDSGKLAALKKYLYEPGPWNDYQPFQYDFNDPMGRNVTNKLLHNFIRTRKGNCVSMPFLFIVIGDRIGLQLTASTAPAHILVKYTDRASGKTYNLEPTSGANIARDEWYREKMPMTDKALRNGLYLRVMSRRETAALMANVVVENLLQQKSYMEAIEISDQLLKFTDKSDFLLLYKGGAYFGLLKEKFLSKYSSPMQIPVRDRAEYERLSRENSYWFSQAESLGWREPPREAEANYARRVREHGVK